MEQSKRVITKDGVVFAIVVQKEIETEGVNFITPVEHPIQVGLLQHKGGKFVDLHFHNNFKYNVNTTHEILYVEEGEIEVVVTDFDWSEIEKVTLSKGEMIILLDGGHSVDLKDGSRVWEFKQGPYPGDSVAKVFKDKWEGDIPKERLHAGI